MLTNEILRPKSVKIKQNQSFSPEGSFLPWRRVWGYKEQLMGKFCLVAGGEPEGGHAEMDMCDPNG